MKPKLLIIILSAALVLVGGGLAAALLLRPPAAPATQAQQPVDEPAALVELDSFVVNLGDDGAGRYAKLNLQLTVKPGNLAHKVASDKLLQAKLRDRTLTLLASKSYDVLITPLGKESLRREIKARLNPLFEGGEIEDVLFSEFMVQ